MNYEETFTDFETMRVEAAWQGFKHKDYGMMYSYLNKRLGTTQANYFQSLSKKEKRELCARVVYLYHPDKEKAEIAKKYYKKHLEDLI